MGLYYETLLCAYALLGEVDDSLIKEMQSYRIVPGNIHRTLVAFDMNKDAMDRLLNALKQWRSIQLDHRIYEAYFLACMLDMVKRGEISIQTDNAIDEQRIQLFKDKMKEAISITSQTFTELEISIFNRWAKLLAFYGDSNGVRAVMSLIFEEEGKSLKPFLSMYPMYWNSLIVSLTNANSSPNEAIAVLDQMLERGHLPDANHYASVLTACGLLISDMNERYNKLFAVYQRMLKQGLRPRDTIFRHMRTFLKDHPEYCEQVLAEARKYNVKLQGASD